MKILWERGESVADLVAAMPKTPSPTPPSSPPSASSKKRATSATARKDARSSTPPASRSRKPAAPRSSHMMHRFFGNSRERLLLSLLGDDEITPRRLQRLKAHRREPHRAAEPKQEGQHNARSLAIVPASRNRRFTASLVASLWHGPLALRRSHRPAPLPALTAAVRFTIWTASLVSSPLPFLPSLPAAEPAHRSTTPHPPRHPLELRDRRNLGRISMPSAPRPTLAQRHAPPPHLPARYPVEPPASRTLAHRRYRPPSSASLTKSSAPSVIGFFTPRILVPARLYRKLSASRARPDRPPRAASTCAAATTGSTSSRSSCLVLFPLNPALLWVERRLCLERDWPATTASSLAPQHPRATPPASSTSPKNASSAAQLVPRLGAWEPPVRTRPPRPPHPRPPQPRASRTQAAQRLPSPSSPSASAVELLRARPRPSTHLLRRRLQPLPQPSIQRRPLQPASAAHALHSLPHRNRPTPAHPSSKHVMPQRHANTAQPSNAPNSSRT